MKAAGTFTRIKLLGHSYLAVDGFASQSCPINMQDRTDLIGRMIRIDGTDAGGWKIRAARWQPIDKVGNPTGPWEAV